MSENIPQSNISRRDFLKTVWAVLGGVALVETSGIFLAYLQPRLADGEFGALINAGKVDSFPLNSVTHLTNARCYIVRLPDGGFLAIYHRCTHLGCTVPWDGSAQKFICPCHSSEFDMQGTVKNPPAPRPLDLFAISLVAGEVKVDTSAPIQRQGYETAQAVYPESGMVYPSTGTVYPESGTVYPSTGTVYPSTGTVYPSTGTVYPSTGTVYP